MTQRHSQFHLLPVMPSSFILTPVLLGHPSSSQGLGETVLSGPLGPGQRAFSDQLSFSPS